MLHLMKNFSGILIPLFVIFLIEILRMLNIPVPHSVLIGMLVMVFAVFVGNLWDGVLSSLVMLIYLGIVFSLSPASLFNSPSSFLSQMTMILIAFPTVAILVSILKYRLEKQAKQLRDLDQVKTEFMSLASHQLRTPLSTIKWYANFLADKKSSKLTKTQQNYLSVIEESNERMIELVETLLDASRMELGDLPLSPTQVILQEIIEDVVKEHTVTIANKKLNIQKQFDAHLPISLVVNKRLLHMMIDNVFSNAIRYSPQKSSIAFSYSLKPNQVEIRISDHGCGIPVQEQSYIFNKFYRAQNAIKQEPNGNGIGLYLVKTLLEKIGGKIWFESHEKTGTTFFVLFPRIWPDRARIS